MNVLAIGNQKGGTAKTTTVAALGVLLSRLGQQVHLIDMDPQASLTAAFGVEDPDGKLYLALKERAALPVVKIDDNLTITPSTIDLTLAEVEFTSLIGREYLLKKSLAKTGRAGEGAVVLIDSPPSLGLLSTNCLVAATSLVVVVKPGGFELRALSHLEKVIRDIKEQANPGLSIVGAIMTDCPGNRKINDAVREEVARFYLDLGKVRSDVRMVEATTQQDILNLRSFPPGAMHDYELVLNKLIEVCPWLKT
jgi:chromosome partitioning protein